LIIDKELGLNFCENPWQGSFIVDKLTDIVEEAVYKEFEAISERGGVLGAMDTMYQRGKIQEESMYYEHKKHDGSLPLVGVNCPAKAMAYGGDIVTQIELIRSTESEKQQQIGNVAAYQQNRNTAAIPTSSVAFPPSPPEPFSPAVEPFSPREKGRDEGPKSESVSVRSRSQDSVRDEPVEPRAEPDALIYLQQTARDRRNVFAALMEAVKTHSLGQISHALYDVGGEYRRNM